ncbi:MAG: ParB/RepB/Spo0J family partition protein [Pseudomonadota bacterium]
MAVAKKQKAGLGRGLDALLGDAPERPTGAQTGATQTGASPAPSEAAPSGRGSAPARELTPEELGLTRSTLPIEFLQPNPDQPRRIFNEDAIAELSSSIKARGMLQPILVRPRGEKLYEIVAGERRWRAAQKAQLHEVPVLIRDLSDAETAEIALIENVQRVDLNPIEEAQAYQHLADVFGRTQDQIAKAVGKSRSHIANLMRLLNLPTKAVDALKSGEISMGHARALLASDDIDKDLSEVLSGALSVRDTEKLVQPKSTDAKRSPASSQKPNDASPVSTLKKDADTRALENDLAAALGLEVMINHSKKGAGEVTIKYLSLDQLDDVCRRLMAAGV